MISVLLKMIEKSTLGAAGLGWKFVWWDGDNSIYLFQQMTGIECKPVPVEITYGLERLCMFVQGKDNVFDLDWNEEVNIKVFFQAEKFSAYNFELQILIHYIKILRLLKTNVKIYLKKSSHYQLMINV